MNFTLLQQVDCFIRSGVKLGIHYYMMAFIIVWYLHVWHASYSVQQGMNLWGFHSSHKMTCSAETTVTNIIIINTVQHLYTEYNADGKNKNSIGIYSGIMLYWNSCDLESMEQNYLLGMCTRSLSILWHNGPCIYSSGVKKRPT